MIKLNRINPLFCVIYMLMIIYTGCILFLYDSLSLRFHASIALYVILLYLIFYKIANKKVITPLTLIIISFCLFQSGQTLLYVIGYENISLLKLALPEEIIIAQIFFNYSLMLLLIGTTITTSFDIKTVESQDVDWNMQISYLKNIGKISLITTLFPTLLVDIIVFKFSLSGEYSEIRNYTTFIISTNGFLYMCNWIAGFFNFALYICLVAFDKDKKARNKLLILMFIVSALELIIGARYEVVTRFLVYIFLILDLSQSKKSSINSVVIVSLGGILIMVLNIIKVFRQLNEKSLSLFISMISQSSGFIDGIIEFIMEMGFSMYPFILINRFVPSKRFFGGGTSYLFSIFSIIPQKLLLGFDYSKYTNLQEWLTFEVLNQKSGVGFSMCAEAYYNFGWFGLSLFFLIGLLIGNIFDSNKRRKRSLSVKLFSVFLFDALLFYPRGQIVTLMRPIILIIGIIILINKGKIKNIKKKH